MNSGSFAIEIDPPAKKELKKLTLAQRNLSEHLIKAIDSLAFHPFQGKPLKGNKKGCYSLRYDVSSHSRKNKPIFIDNILSM